jgi:hypothetical protein
MSLVSVAEVALSVEACSALKVKNHRMVVHLVAWLGILGGSAG